MAIHTAYSVRVNSAYPTTTRRSPPFPASARNTARRRLAKVDALIPMILRMRCPQKRPHANRAELAPDGQMPSSRGRSPGPGGLDGFRPVEQRPAAQPLGDAGGLVLVHAQQVGGVVEQPVGQVVGGGLLAQAARDNRLTTPWAAPYRGAAVPAEPVALPNGRAASRAPVHQAFITPGRALSKWAQPRLAPPRASTFPGVLGEPAVGQPH